MQTANLKASLRKGPTGCNTQSQLFEYKKQKHMVFVMLDKENLAANRFNGG